MSISTVVRFQRSNRELLGWSGARAMTVSLFAPIFGHRIRKGGGYTYKFLVYITLKLEKWGYKAPPCHPLKVENRGYIPYAPFCIPDDKLEKGGYTR